MRICFFLRERLVASPDSGGILPEPAQNAELVSRTMTLCKERNILRWRWKAQPNRRSSSELGLDQKSSMMTFSDLLCDVEAEAVPQVTLSAVKRLKQMALLCFAHSDAIIRDHDFNVIL
jgi:hypothetical protein